MLPIDSPMVISYSTYIIVSLTVFEIFDCNLDDLKLGLFKVIQGEGHGDNRKPIDGFLTDLQCV